MTDLQVNLYNELIRKCEDNMFLDINDKSMKYIKNYKISNIIHWGQRKLLLTELVFLTQFYKLSKYIVYAGAAPGTHIELLSLYFPDNIFILFDPRHIELNNKICHRITNFNNYSSDISNLGNKKIIIYEDTYFNEEIASALKSLNPLFICDIRTATTEDQKDIVLNEGKVLQDINNQFQWVKLMDPVKSIIKYRCLYNEKIINETYGNKTPIMGSLILKQPWAPIKSTETRIIIDKSENNIIKQYDNKLYEEQMFYHNVNRNTFFNDNIIKICSNDIINNGFDANMEIYIYIDYLNKVRQYKLKNIKMEHINNILLDIEYYMGRSMDKHINIKTNTR